LLSVECSALLIREAVAQTTHEVKITDFAFVPQDLTIKLGDTVMWNNTDPVIHTLWFVFVADGSTYLLSDPIPHDTTWTHTFNEAVKLQYYSFDKLWITGFIKVTLPGDANGGCKVGTVDLSMLGGAWDTSEAEPHNELLGTTYDPACDFNGDKKIGTADLSIMGTYWGQTDP